MAVMCANCGEELLGAVNRCWRCGQAVAAHHGDAAMPPVRRDPLPLDQVQVGQEETVAAEIVNPPVDEARSATSESPALADETKRFKPAETGTANDAALAAAVAGEEDGTSQPPRRAGSPFHASVPPRPTATRGGSRPARRRGNPAAVGGAIASLFLGVVSSTCGFLTPMAMIAALVGIPMGIWGLTSPRRKSSLAGILLCCLGIAVSGTHAVIQIYRQEGQRAPWEEPAVDEDEISW